MSGWQNGDELTHILTMNLVFSITNPKACIRGLTDYTMILILQQIMRLMNVDPTYLQENLPLVHPKSA
jgi:hypothetical protein